MELDSIWDASLRCSPVRLDRTTIRNVVLIRDKGGKNDASPSQVMPSPENPGGQGPHSATGGIDPTTSEHSAEYGGSSKQGLAPGKQATT